ncbi:hypothetical protein [Paraflavitalea sp. CAU 1676]|uniref:hypothetical protein n=1 Tax=Paraflavitalea sp. CAU 1676 TaxID=3032598 RepID=UPI0023DA72D0|nr:hypothetical protein [Paraflavitalea sp. CAU 1676]MDF2192619.1 hypothetical protein [Paraflavitalea sp. CAU 1676]
MIFSQPRQFWTWFERYSEVLRHLPDMDKKEREFWIREIATHLRAYTKKLSVEMIMPPQGAILLVFTAYGKQRYFAMADNFVAKAPRLKGWEVCALQPPGMLDSLLVTQYGHFGVDLSTLRFKPLERGLGEDKFTLYIVADINGHPTEAIEMAVEAAVYNTVGERVVGEQMNFIVVDCLSHYAPREKKKFIDLAELPVHIAALVGPRLSIDHEGNLKAS